MELTSHRKVIEELAKQMVAEGLITADQLAICQVSQEDLGQDLGHILIKKGFVTEGQLLTFLGRALSIRYVSLKKHPIDHELVRKVPLQMARRYRLVPLEKRNGQVVVAMADPLDVFALDDVREKFDTEIQPVLASADEIDETIERCYRLERPREMVLDRDLSIVSSSSEDSLEGVEEKLKEIAAGPRVIQTVNQIVLEAHRDRASDIHLEPTRDKVRVRYRIDGLLEDQPHLSHEMLLPVVSRIKILAGLDIAERRIPQDGRVQWRMGGGPPLDLRVSTYPTLYGEKVVLRLLAKETVIGIEDLGFSERDRKLFAELIARSHGVFLVTGPTGSGKSTTLYAALSRLNAPEKNIVSIEDPVESEVAGVNQAQVNLKAGITFASALRAILRQDPDVIMIGEIRDVETAEISVRAAITGHLVLSTIHTNSAAGVISRLIDLKVEPFLVSSSLIGVLAQRLVRKICLQCRVEAPVPASIPPAAGGHEGRTPTKAFRGRGCPACRMSGFSGRLGIFELAPVTEAVGQMILEKASDDEIGRAFRKMGVPSLLEDGLAKVEMGLTTLEEVVHSVQER